MASGFVPPIYRRALVAFTGRSGLAWLRWLRPGFRHCFVALDDGTSWLTLDPLLHRIEVRATGLSSEFDLASEYRSRDLTVVEVAPAPVRFRCAPLGLFTCVEAVKRVLGIHARWVMTPWQLYRHLIRRTAESAPSKSALALDENKTRNYS